LSNLIFNAFASKKDFQTSPQIGGNVTSDVLDIYLKNIFVSLLSAKFNNPHDDVALVCNISLPERFEHLFHENNIQILYVEFTSFVMPADFHWALAFYKLCAYDWVVANTEYDKYMMIDADTVSVRSFDDIWEEANYGLLLYNINHSYSHKDRKIIQNTYDKLYKTENKNIIHYGGEFICSKRSNVGAFLSECKSVYTLMEESNFTVDTTIGDEALISIAASHFKIIEAGAYIYRYWTGSFYLVSTNYINNPVCIWHLPSEKKYGMLYLFEYILKNRKLPAIGKMRSAFGFPKKKRPITSMFLLIIFKRVVNNVLRGKNYE